jgi:hypothetical protein
VQVDVLVAVDIGDLRAAAVAQPDRLRRGDLPAGGDAAGEMLRRLDSQARGGGLTADEDLLLLRDDLSERGVGGELGIGGELGVGVACVASGVACVVTSEAPVLTERSV